MVASEWYKKARIYLLTRRAMMLYTQIRAGYADLDCGSKLAEFIRPDLRPAINEFNEVMEELATLDPRARAILDKHGKL